ncbi:MAG: hypothetical protein AAF548_05095 [Actinomycetota bacterium]
MATFDDLPVPGDPDPATSEDPDVLRAEILRLRESLLAVNGRTEVLRDRITELEQRERELDDANRELHEELRRNPLHRIAAAVRRRIGSDA